MCRRILALLLIATFVAIAWTNSETEVPETSEVVAERVTRIYEDPQDADFKETLVEEVPSDEPPHLAKTAVPKKHTHNQRSSRSSLQAEAGL
jgi:hypothetical protein